MDKYQEYVKKNIQFLFKLDAELTKAHENTGWRNIEDKIIVNQAEDYNITKYYLVLRSNVIDSVTYLGKEYSPVVIKDGGEPLYIICLDFNNKGKELIISSSAVEPFEVEIVFNEVDHKIFDDKVEKANQDELASKACINISTGSDLVNIYFQPCCDSYEKTVVELYLAEGKYSQPPMVMGKHDVFHPQLLSATAGQLMGRFESDKGMLFKSITGLAHHAYAVKISQLDKDGKVLFTTDYKYFDIR